MKGRNDAHTRHVLQVLAEERKRYAEFDFDPDYRGPANGSWQYLRALASKGPNANPRDVDSLTANSLVQRSSKKLENSRAKPAPTLTPNLAAAGLLRPQLPISA
jgi:hypothetical protein